MANTVNVTVTGQDKSGPAINSATQGLKNIGTVAAGVLSANILQGAAQRMTSFVASTVKAASNLGESVNAVGKVFGSEADHVIKWGQDNAAAFGLSQRAFNQLVTPMGALLKNSGMALDEVSNNTIELTKRAADMASVFNTDVSQALNAIQAGLRGESDPLEQFGVHLSAAAVESEALAESGKSVASSLTEQEKATARVNLIMKQTADVAGDFAATSDGLANSQRKAAAELENAQAKIGSAFLPILAKAAQAVGALAEGFSKIPGPMQVTLAVIGTLAAAFVVLAPKISAARDLIRGFGGEAEFSSTKVGKLTIAAGKVGGALLALQAIGALTSQVFGDKLPTNIEAAAKALETWNGRTKLTGAAADAFGDNLSDVGDAFQQLTQNGFAESVNGIDNWAAHLIGTTGPIDDAQANAQKFDAVLVQLVKTGHEAAAAELVRKAAVDEGNVSVNDALKALPGYQQALSDSKKASDDLATATNNAKNSVQDLQAEFQKTDPLFAFMDAQKNVTEAQKAYNDAVKTSGKNSKDAKEKLADLAQAAIDLSGKAKDAAGSFDGHFSPAARRMLSAAGLTKKEIADLEADLRRAKSSADKLDGTNAKVTITTAHVDTYSTAPGYQGGGRAQASGGITGAAGGGIRAGLTLVGEHGPEFADLPPGTNVKSNPDTMRMLSGASTGSGVTVNLYVQGSIRSDRDLIKIIRDEIVNGGLRGALLAA